MERLTFNHIAGSVFLINDSSLQLPRVLSGPSDQRTSTMSLDLIHKMFVQVPKEDSDVQPPTTYNTGTEQRQPGSLTPTFPTIRPLQLYRKYADCSVHVCMSH